MAKRLVDYTDDELQRELERREVFTMGEQHDDPVTDPAVEGEEYEGDAPEEDQDDDEEGEAADEEAEEDDK